MNPTIVVKLEVCIRKYSETKIIFLINKKKNLERETRERNKYSLVEINVGDGKPRHEASDP